VFAFRLDQRGDGLLEVVRIDRLDVGDTQGPRHGLRRGPRLPTIVVVAPGCRRARLVSGHTGHAVVQHDHHDVVPRLGGVEQRRHAGVKEGGVTDEGKGLSFEHAAGRGSHGDGRAHRQQGVHGLERWAVPQRVATDVVEVDSFFAEDGAGGEVGPAVGTAGTEGGWPGDDLGRRGAFVPLATQAGEGRKRIPQHVRFVPETVGQVSGALAQDLHVGT